MSIPTASIATARAQEANAIQAKERAPPDTPRSAVTMPAAPNPAPAATARAAAWPAYMPQKASVRLIG